LVPQELIDVATNYKAGGATSTAPAEVKEEVETTAATEPIAQETVADGQRILASPLENCK
jgi:hypothetical protein